MEVERDVPANAIYKAYKMCEQDLPQGQSALDDPLERYSDSLLRWMPNGESFTIVSSRKFAKSGQVQGQIQRGMEAGATSFGFERQGLQDVLCQKLMDISEWEGGEQGRIKSEEARLKYEMAEAQAQSKKKFLGIF